VRKGDNMPDRPYRRSRLDIPDALPEPVSLEQLRWLSRQAAETARVTVPRTGAQVTAGRRLDAPAYLAAAGLVEGQDYRIKHKKGVTWYNFRLCPVHADPHANFECGICQSDDGAMGAKCQHDSTKSWRDFKAALGNPARFPIGAAAEEVQPEPSTLPTLREFDLDEVLAFARCPTEHLWRYKTATTPPLNSLGLVHEITRTGLLRFFDSAVPSPLEGVLSRWREKLEAWEIAKAFDVLDKYARMRIEISIPFISGQRKQRNGQLYPTPRMAEAYHNLYEEKGLVNVRAEADALARGIAVVLGTDSLADLFADTVEIALRFKKPDPLQILGVQEPFSVCLPNGRLLNGRADLALLDTQAGETLLEFWDWSPMPLTWESLRHDLRVIAALYARSDKWRDSVDCVRVRYLRAGEIVNVYGRNRPAWMQPLLVMACQAVSACPIAVPRLATSVFQCEQCLYRAECMNEEAWNALGTANG
jgi:hypothetical protein